MPNLFAKLFRKKKPESDTDALVEQHANVKKKKVVSRKLSPSKRGKKTGPETGSSVTSSTTTEVAANKVIPSVLSPNKSSSPDKTLSPYSKTATTSTSILLEQKNAGGSGSDFAPSTASTSKTSDRGSPTLSAMEETDPLRPSPFSKSGRTLMGPDLSQGSQRTLNQRNTPPASTRNAIGPVDLDEDNTSFDADEENMVRRAALPIFGLEKATQSVSPNAHTKAVDLSHDDTSSFNISTDVSDMEYETMKRTLGAGGLDQSVASTYKSDGEGSIFPNLVDEDSLKADDNGFSAAWDPNSPIHDFPITNNTASTGNGFAPSTGNVTGFPSPPQSASEAPSFFKSSRSLRLQPASSPTSQSGSEPAFHDDFANFADFANFDSAWPVDSRAAKSDSRKGTTPPAASSSESSAANQSPTSPTAKKPTSRVYIETGRLGSSTSRLETSNSAGASLSTRETSLTELLAQAKSKSTRKSASSVNSAPVPSSYLQQHRSRRSESSKLSSEGGGAGAAASVSDIIQSLDAAAKSRDSGGSVISAKERLKKNRRDQQESDELDDAAEAWLYGEVTEALGPQGIAADLESLSGRSQKSGGERSNKSHRSKSKSRRSRRTSSGESVGSKDSKRSSASRRSRSSRYSHRSTKSYISQMSEQSRSVANDLLRLEMQLAMVGQSQQDTGSAGGEPGKSATGSESGNRPSRSKTSSASNRRSTHPSAARSRITVMAPPGKLGIILANKADSKGTVVSGVRTSSVLAEKISPGDRIVAIDGEDVSLMTVSEITTIMARKADFERTLTVLTTPRVIGNGDGSSQASSKHRN